MSKKVIITGITGMSGSHMVDYLLENTNNQVFGIVRRVANPNYQNIKHVFNNPRFKMFVGDLTDPHSIEKIIVDVKPDYFINFAAQSHVHTSWEVPEQTFDTTATALIRILEVIRKNVPTCRIYSAGSSEQFGDVLYTPQDEKHPLRPQSPYGAAKCAAGLIIRVYRESYGLYAVHGILFNHEGERRGENFVTRKITKGVARIYHAIKNRENFEPIELGNLDAKRDWSYAPEFIDGIWRMLNQDIYRSDVNEMIKDYDKSGKLLLPREVNPTWHKILVKNIKDYVLASGETHIIRDFIELAFKKAGIQGYWLGKEENEKFCLAEEYGIISYPINTPLIKVNSKFCRPAEVNYLCGDSYLARKELGWQPKVGFNELVKIMVDYDIKNYDTRTN